MNLIKKPFTQLRRRNWALRLLAAAGLVASVTGGNDVRATPATFPTAGWVVALNGGQPVVDVQNDTQGSRDIVGDPANPMLYIASDATHLFFRLRVDANPLQGPTNFRAFGWGCLINTDSDLTTYEYSAFVNGVANPDELSFYKNTVTTKPNDPTDPPEITLSTAVNPLATTVGHAQVISAPSMFGGTPDFFIDWAVELTDALAGGFNPANPANYYCGSSNNGSTLTADCSGGTTCGTLDSQFTDPISCGPLGCAICGDGSKGAAEGCDDGNRTNGDGCNSVCLIELGKTCTVSSGCASGYCDTAGNVCACDQDTDCPVGQVCNLAANPNACVVPGCGNGVVEMGEGCDDGNTTNGDGCNSSCLKEIGQTCTSDMVCASGFCDPDDGKCECNDNGDCPMPNVCNVLASPNACVAPGCGNHVLETGEGCDDGNTTSGDGCNNVCLIELLQGCTDSNGCASGLCDPGANICVCVGSEDCGINEACNTTLNPHQCVPTGCGNGTLNPGEGCDDGNLNNGDGCNAQCLKELGQTCSTTNPGACASGFCDPAGNVCACDADVDCPGFQLCNVQSDPNTCVDPGCGNNVIEAGEACDDGNKMNGDGCNSVCLKEIGEACTVASQCASGYCDPMDQTCACDENADCSGTDVCKLSTSPPTCVPAGCGNGVLEMNEACDDNNTMNGDGCNSACLLEIGQSCPGGSTTCASGFCDPIGTVCACDEDADCPSMQLCNQLASPNLCVDKGCGNGVLEMGEGCDDNNKTDGDGCSSTCLLEIGQSCPGGSSTCQSGFCDSTDSTCACDSNADCSGGQVCNTVAAPNVCVDPGCGNFVVEPGEGCDDGNTTSGDGCNATCLIELGKPCQGASSDCESGFCDPQGVCACDMDSDCPSDTVCNLSSSPHACVSIFCGNGVVDANEGCDDGNMMSGDGCDANCKKELGQTCTDGAECGSSNCDGTTNQCVCNIDADCSNGQICNTGANPHACVDPGCGNGVVEANEGCDDGNTMPGDGCDANCAIELGQPCTVSTQCASGNCDEMTTVCVCDKDADCPMGQTCDTMAAPHACVDSPGCSKDSDCPSGKVCDEPSKACVDCTQNSECMSGVCDTASFTCVACLVDSDCTDGGICSAESHTCTPKPVIIEGGGVVCTASPVSSNSSTSWPFGLLGLLGLGALRRRRR